MSAPPSRRVAPDGLTCFEITGTRSLACDHWQGAGTCAGTFTGDGTRVGPRSPPRAQSIAAASRRTTRAVKSGVGRRPDRGRIETPAMAIRPAVSPSDLGTGVPGDELFGTGVPVPNKGWHRIP